ncbi:hypothetical protein ACQRD6_03765 [Prevotella sp. SGI.027]
MKTTLKTLSIFLCALLLSVGFAACSDDTDPAEAKVFTDVYKGKISYVNLKTDKKITANDGKVTVTKLGNSYSFFFNNGIPDLTNIKFSKQGDNTFVSIGSDGLKGIKIDESTLHILYVKGKETWTADCTR